MKHSLPTIPALVVTRWDENAGERGTGDYVVESRDVEILSINLNTKNLTVRYMADIFNRGKESVKTSTIGFDSVNLNDLRRCTEAWMTELWTSSLNDGQRDDMDEAYYGGNDNE